jgi:F-type H+-transporting ATPase subunit gamma
METLEALGHQIGAVEDLQSVVKTMKGLAAVNIRQYEQAVAALRDYNRSLELGLQILLKTVPEAIGMLSTERRGRTAAVVLGSDQGMCGQFNTRIVSHAREQLKTRNHSDDRPRVLAVGIRVQAELEMSPLGVDDGMTLPGSVAEITRCVRDLVLRVQRWRSEAGVHRVRLFHHRPTGGASYEARSLQLIPFDRPWLEQLRDAPWPTRMLPMFTMDWRALMTSLIRQYLFASLYRGLAESLAAENAARLASMQAAENNVEERLSELTQRYHRRRQNAITEELLDVTAGFEVLSGK